MENCIKIYSAFFVSGVKEEPDGDCQETNGAYGESRRHYLQR